MHETNELVHFLQSLTPQQLSKYQMLLTTYSDDPGWFVQLGLLITLKLQSGASNFHIPETGVYVA